jgi:putative heme iron utilization protein
MSDDIQAKIDELIASRKTLLLATLNAEKQAEISVTPFIRQGLNFYIFVSELSNHTRNLKIHPALSVMLVEDEQDTQNAFARKRLTYQCQATEILKEDETREELLNYFEQKHGKTVSLLKALPDFHLFELNAVSGQYVQGFGQAYSLSGQGLKILTLQGK